jgi:hypothetical protein
MKTLGWLILFVSAAVVAYLLLSTLLKVDPERRGIVKIAVWNEVMTSEWITTRVHARFVVNTEGGHRVVNRLTIGTEALP